jgi:hypothetical protein
VSVGAAIGGFMIGVRLIVGMRLIGVFPYGGRNSSLRKDCALVSNIRGEIGTMR